MRSEEHIKSKMSRLSDYLRQQDSLVPAVLERLESEVVTPERKPVSGGIRLRLAVTVAAFLLLGFLAIWMRPFSLEVGLAYAEVRQAIRNIESAIVDYEDFQRPHKNRRVLLRRDTDIARIEYPNGVTYVRDTQQGRCLVLDEIDKTAQIFPGLQGEFSAAENLDEMANFDRDAVEPIGARIVGGRELIGFRVRQHKPDRKQEVDDTIWVDPETRLPAIREYTRAATRLEKGSFRRQIYTFNQPIAPALFDMTPPKDHRLVSSDEATIGTLPKRELPAELPPGPTLKPRIGIGEITFGMTAEQIVETLGKADQISSTWSHTPEESRLIDEAQRKARKLDEFEGQRLIDEAEAKVGASVRQREPDATRMEYDRLGIELDVSNREGLVGGFCWYHGHGDNYPYTGTTTEGIGLGSTMAEIEEAYGPPDGARARKIRNILKGLRDAVWEQSDGQGKRKRDSFGIWYESRGLHFMLSKGKVRYIVFNRGIDR